MKVTLQEDNPGFKPHYFMADNCGAEHNAVEHTWTRGEFNIIT